MAVALSVKDVPDSLAKALRARAARNHRSLQGELMHILQTAVGPKPFDIDGLRAAIKELNFSTPSESVRMVRETRDER
jgi:plasmid stability protein